MVKHFLTPAAVILAAVLSGQARPLPEEKPTPHLVGRWAIVEMYLSGVKQPPEACQEQQIEFTKAEFLFVSLKWKLTIRHRFRIDDRKFPHELDLYDEGEGQPAIYKAHERGVVIVFGRNGKDRPTVFEPREGDGRIQYTLKRITSER